MVESLNEVIEVIFDFNLIGRNVIVCFLDDIVNDFNSELN